MKLSQSSAAAKLCWFAAKYGAPCTNKKETEKQFTAILPNSCDLRVVVCDCRKTFTVWLAPDQHIYRRSEIQLPIDAEMKNDFLIE